MGPWALRGPGGPGGGGRPAGRRLGASGRRRAAATAWSYTPGDRCSELCVPRGCSSNNATHPYYCDRPRNVPLLPFARNGAVLDDSTWGSHDAAVFTDSTLVMVFPTKTDSTITSHEFYVYDLDHTTYNNFPSNINSRTYMNIFSYY